MSESIAGSRLTKVNIEVFDAETTLLGANLVIFVPGILIAPIPDHRGRCPPTLVKRMRDISPITLLPH
jgi:hypothetical protein